MIIVYLQGETFMLKSNAAHYQSTPYGFSTTGSNEVVQPRLRVLRLERFTLQTVSLSSSSDERRTCADMVPNDIQPTGRALRQVRSIDRYPFNSDAAYTSDHRVILRIGAYCACIQPREDAGTEGRDHELFSA